MRKVKQTKQKEIGRIKLSNTRELVASLVDGEKLNLRIRREGSSRRATKQRRISDT